MRIFIDIGHPAHVHYFRFFIDKMQSKGHAVFVTSRDKEITFELLHHYKIPYISRGKGGNGLWKKLIYIFKADRLLLKLAKSFKPDLFLSFASTYAAHAAKLYGVPHIAIDDTEHARLEHLMYVPFTDVILTPSCFNKDFGKKQIRFNSYIEFSYLHKQIFSPDLNIRAKLGLNEKEKFVLFRFISWNASHDIGHKGISNGLKKQMIELLVQKNYRVFISSEKDLDDYFSPFLLPTNISEIHSVIREASFFIGESGTMSTEACILGTPAVFVNSLDAGVFQEEVAYGLLYSYRNDDNLLHKVKELIETQGIKEEHQKRAERLHTEKINISDFLVWFVENYPHSKNVMINEPGYQALFK